MSRDFDRAVEVIFELEGYDEAVVDSGGFTRWGISTKAHPDVDIANLTKEGATKIYYDEYWLKVRADQLAWPLSIYVFDAGVNQGVKSAKKMLQDAAGGLKIDGWIGQKSLARIGRLPPKELAARFMAKRCQRYAGTRHYDKYGYGWFARLFRLVDRAS